MRRAKRDGEDIEAWMVRIRRGITMIKGYCLYRWMVGLVVDGVLHFPAS